MQIKEVILENFRGYKNLTRIPISSLTAFIGKNDAGKSTILEALDIFFEGGVKKIESADASKGGDAKNVKIGVVFNNLPEKVVLDTNATTTFGNEHLLNNEGNLEIHKIYNCSLASPKAKIFANANYPNAEDVDDLIQKSNKDLKAIIKKRNLEEKCNKTENPSMRLAIYEAEDNLELTQKLISLNEDNGKAIWSAIQGHLPIFALFQSDRPSTDQDSEVQDPMKIAIKRALENLEGELDAISKKVSEQAQATAESTLKKLQSSYPNLASTLTPKFKKPNWGSVFKLELEADDEIPLNKRGSGVRRLILMSFFQAEAEKKQNEKSPRRPVVYAIEEPETSQHPDSQERIIEAFKVISESGDQVLLTTHVPGLAGLIPLDSLRYIDEDIDTNQTRIREGTEEVYNEIAKALGVIPDPISSTNLKVAVLVEGKHDIDALKSMLSTLSKDNEIEISDDKDIFWTIGGGETLKDWIERGYLDRLNLPQVIIRDSDRTSSKIPLSDDLTNWLKDINAQSNKKAFITQKRNMDNYLHPSALKRVSNDKFQFTEEVDIDFDQMSDVIAKMFALLKTEECKFYPKDHEGNKIRATKRNSKHIIAAYIISEMTSDEIKERGQYKNENGEDENEIVDWFKAISSFCNPTPTS